MSDNYTVNSSVKGPYDSSTQAGQGANVGFNVVQTTKDGSIFGKSIQYSNGTNDDFLLGYSQVTVASMNSDEDTVITAKDKKWEDLANVYNEFYDTSKIDPALLTDGKVDAQKVFDKFDLNDDGEYDAAEDAAFTKLQDQVAKNKNFNKIGTGTANDGIVTPDEMDTGCNYMFVSANAGKKLSTIYKENKLEEKYNRFKETGTSVESTDTETSTENVTESGDTIVGSQHGHNILRTDPSKDIFNQPSRTIHGLTIHKTTTPEDNPAYQKNRKVVDDDD